MKSTMDSMIQGIATVAGTAMKATENLAEIGRQKLDRTVLQNKLDRLHKQLGELVYTLEKSDESNSPMIAHYVAEIDKLKKLLQQVEKQEKEKEDTVCVCTEVKEDAVFCGGDGDELP